MIPVSKVSGLRLEPGGKVEASARLAFMLSYNMAKSIKDIPKKRGRPATGKDPMIGARMPTTLTDAVDAWAAKTAGGIPRADAIRRLIEFGLRTKEGASEPSRIRLRRKRTSLQVAQEQIEAAISHFYEGQFACAITLAGAAEECAGPSQRDDRPLALFEMIKASARKRGLEEKTVANNANAVRNWLKHHNAEKPDCEISDLDAWFMMVRAVSKLYAVDAKTETPAVRAFVEFSRKHYADQMAKR